MSLTDEHMDKLARGLIPILDKVGDMAEDKKLQTGYHAPDHLAAQPHDPASMILEDNDTGGFKLPGDERLTWAIQGQAVMVTNIPEQRQDGSYRIVLSSSENWVLKSVLMSGLDSSTEIELILAPRI